MVAMDREATGWEYIFLVTVALAIAVQWFVG
jgi:hypothetical protein